MPRWEFLKPGRADATAIKAHLAANGLGDAEVETRETGDGQTRVIVYTGSDPTMMLGAFVEPERGKTRADFKLQIQSVGNIADVRKILLRLLDRVEFDDDS